MPNQLDAQSTRNQRICSGTRVFFVIGCIINKLNIRLNKSWSQITYFHCLANPPYFITSQLSNIRKIDDAKMDRKKLIRANTEVALASTSKSQKSNKKRKTKHTKETT